MIKKGFISNEICQFGLKNVCLSFLTFILILLTTTKVSAQSDSLNYFEYHKKIIEAEELIFLKNDSIGGLLLFDSVFKEYDFVFVDDCIEAFQLAILFKRDDLAMNFIKKVMDNGFRLKLLDGLDCVCCPHNFYKDKKKVTIFNDFIKKNHKSLTTYEKTAYAKYIKRNNKKLLHLVVQRHIKEQIYKNYIPAMGVKLHVYKKRYEEVSSSNLSFIHAHFKNNKFIGERNIGLVDNQLLKDIGINYLNENKSLDSLILIRYGLPNGTYVPVRGQELKAYFGATYLYIMLFHNSNSYKALLKYKDEAIKQGYLHPREYANLKLKINNKKNVRINIKAMKLNSFIKEIENTVEINKLREKYLIPKYEVDFKKHELAHKYCLKLSFGFSGGTK